MWPPDREIGGQLSTDLDLAHFGTASVSIRRRGLQVLSERIGKIRLQIRPQDGLIVLNGEDTVGL